MSESPIDTLQLQLCLERWRGGDREAADELLRIVGDRLEKLTRKMLRGFPNVRPIADTADVLQESLLRLLHTLRKMQPNSARHFFNLAAVHIRRELLDQARRCACRLKFEAYSIDEAEGDRVAGLAHIPDHAALSVENLEEWCQFHEMIDQLPAEEREVVGLVFYHGWTQAQIAELFQIDERSVRRRWLSACLKLNRLLGGRLPALGS